MQSETIDAIIVPLTHPVKITMNDSFAMQIGQTDMYLIKLFLDR